MKITYIINDISGQGGLAHILSIKTSLLIHKYGHEVTLIVSSALNETFYSFDPSVKIKQLPIPKNFSVYKLTYFKRLKKEIRQSTPNCGVICDNGLKGYLTCFLRIPAPVIFECHSIDFVPFLLTGRKHLSLNRYFLKKLVDVALKQADKIVMLTESHANFLGFKNALIIPNPTWYIPKKKAVLQSNRAIAVGRLVKSKGFNRMIHAWKKIHSAYPHWSLDIYGEGNQKKHIKKLIDKYDLEDSIQLKGSANNMEQIFPQYAFLIHTSFYESFSLVIQQAMSFGLPAIAFDCPIGPRELIRHEQDGFLIEEYDNENFIKKTKLLIADTALRKSYGGKAFKAIKRYDLSEIMDTWNALFLSTQKD